MGSVEIRSSVNFFSGFMRERRSFPISGEVALKSEKDGAGRGLVVNSVLCGVVDELSNGRTGRRGSWVRHAVMGVLRWKDLTGGVRTNTPSEQKEVIFIKSFLSNVSKVYVI